MIDFLNNYLLTPYVQAVLFFILIGMFVLQHRKFKYVSATSIWLRAIILLVLFLYFAWSWATAIPPSLRAASVLFMFLINLHMIHNLVLGNLNEKYHAALEAYGKDVGNKNLLESVWATGKKYIYSRYFLDALFSGYAPNSFLKGVVSGQIPNDIQEVLTKHGIDKELVTHQKLIAFLMMKLRQGQELPQELKDILAQDIKKFDEHAWVQEQVNEFLRLALRDPEQLYEANWNNTQS